MTLVEETRTRTAAQPASWTPELVGQRLVQAFEVLERLPADRVPRPPRSNWPRPMVEWSDHLAQLELDEGERREREKSKNRTILRPTGEEITKMEAAFEWLRRLHAVDEQMAKTLGLWALWTAKGRTIVGRGGLCWVRGLRPRTFWRRRAEGIKWITALLIAHGWPPD
jgi:hypothetical protein